jgi:hypothetical protein
MFTDKPPQDKDRADYFESDRINIGIGSQLFHLDNMLAHLLESC